MNELTVKFNNKDYTAKYNSQAKVYELELEAPKGGIYTAYTEFTNIQNEKYQMETDIQIKAKKKICIHTNDTFMWIFDWKNLKVKGILEIFDYELNIDEETNSNSLVTVLKETKANFNDIVIIKRENQKIFWGIIDKIENDNGTDRYKYTLKYITNMFDQNIELKKRRVNVDNIEEGYYIIHSKLNDNYVVDIHNADTATKTNVQLYGFNNTKAQKFKIVKNTNGSYKIIALFSGLVFDVDDAIFADGTNVSVYTDTGGEAQQWDIRKVGDKTYSIFCHNKNFCLDIDNAQVGNEVNVQIYTSNGSEAQKFELEKIEEEIIRDVGIEDFIKKAIEDNFINSEDVFLNRTYIEVIAKTHTKIEIGVSDVNNNIYNLHKWMTTCNQKYNITFDFQIIDKKLIITIENKKQKKKIIDVNAHSITNYSETFETNIVSKIVVVTKKDGTYELFLKNDGTTTEDKQDKDRILGKTDTLYCEKIEDAKQTAIDGFKANSYNHNISYNFNEYIAVGTPTIMKTKKSIIRDTYISSIKITPNKYYSYTCGNIRTDFIEKFLQKERKNV